MVITVDTEWNFWRAESRWLPKVPAAQRSAKKPTSEASPRAGSAPAVYILEWAVVEARLSDRNLNYAVTQALGSLGPSFSTQPHLLKLALGKCG